MRNTVRAHTELILRVWVRVWVRSQPSKHRYLLATWLKAAVFQPFFIFFYGVRIRCLNPRFDHRILLSRKISETRNGPIPAFDCIGSNESTCRRFERCLPFAFARAGAQRSSAARCTLVAPRSQRSRWTVGGGLPARAVDGRRICLVAACWSTCELHRVVGTAPQLLAMRLELQLRASVAFTQFVRDSTA